MWRWLRAWVVVASACGGDAPPAPPAKPRAAAPEQRASREPPPHDAPESPPREPESPPHEPEGSVGQVGGLCASGDACLESALRARRAGRHAEAIEALSRGCELGHAGSCYRLGEAHRAGVGVEADEERAASLFRDACAAGSQAACDAIGH